MLTYENVLKLGKSYLNVTIWPNTVKLVSLKKSNE